jgi:polysaccharide biosynthesis/export protein
MRFKFFTFLLLSAAIGIPVSAQKTSGDSYTGQGYLIGPGDVLNIKALGEPTFDVDALTVDEDGMIVIPYSDTPIPAKCKTERDLQAEVGKAWSKYLRSPQITLRVTKRDSRPPVSVFGEVQKQEQFVLTRRVYLLEVLSAAGGPTAKNGGMVQVFRTRPPMCSSPAELSGWTASNDSAIGVPSKMYSLAALRLGNSDANPEIFPGDIIIIPKASPVYVIGEVVRPGEIDIPEGGLPLTQAIAMASGISREAKSKNVRIHRKKAGVPTPEVLAVNYDQIRKGEQKDIMLQPFDIVEVDKARKSFTDIMYDMLIGLPNRVPIPIL